MKLNDRYDSTNDPFRGDRLLRLRSIPAGARIRRARATITPESAPAAVERFTEVIDFTSDSSEKWGATRSTGQAQNSIGWAEVDFHSRSTLARVEGDIDNATLQADFGGAYVEINSVGAIKTPNANNSDFTTGLSPADLPGLTVSKFKLTRASNTKPVINKVTIRSVPTNINLRFGEMPAFWTRVGEMTQAETTPDFTLALQAFLAETGPENGFYNVPLIIHSDSIARLRIDMDVEFDIEENALNGLNSLALPFNFSRAPDVAQQALQLTMPVNSKISPRASRARLTGNFAETRIAYDPMEKVVTQAGSPVGSVRSVTPVDKIGIAPDSAQAQPVSFDREISAVAIDLLLEVKETVRLQIDLREDLDGKPGPASLLSKAINFEVPGPAGLERTLEPTVAAKWISVALPGEFKFKASDEQTRRRYWMIVQSIEGEAQWSVAGATDAPNLIEPLGIQRSVAAGLAWRESAAPKVTGALTAFFRLRRKPDRFEMPIALQIGGGEQAVRISLDRFAPTGSVDFALNFDDFNKGLDEYLKTRAPACSEAEHLLNEDFDDWPGLVIPADGAISSAANEAPVDQPAEWNIIGGVKRYPLPGSPFVPGLQKPLALLGLKSSPGGKFENAQGVLMQVTPVIEGCAYDFSFQALASGEDAFAEITWLGETCGSLAQVPVRVPIEMPNHQEPNTGLSTSGLPSHEIFLRANLPRLKFHRVRAAAPAGARQAQVRFIAPEGVVAILDNVSLMSKTETVTNGDFQLKKGDQPTDWVSLSGAPLSLPPPPPNKLNKFNDDAQNPLEIMQTIAIKPDQPFTLTVKKGETIFQGTRRTLPRVEARWFRADGSETGSPVVLELDPASFGAISASGASPGDAANAEVHLLIPAQTSQEIESISLDFPTHTIIPVTFTAQAPGELTVTEWQIGFEAVPGTRPPIPPGGLCVPAQPGGSPGETSDADCFCKCCGSHQPMVNASAAITGKGTPARVGQCANCGEGMISFGGKLALNAPKLVSRRMTAPQPVFINATAVKADPAPVEPAPITAVKGIGEQTAERLAGFGITSLETLAAATPAQVAQVKGISEALAAKFIAQARDLTGEHP